MEQSSAHWLAELEIQDLAFMDSSDINPEGHFNPQNLLSSTVGEESQYPICSDSYSSLFSFSTMDTSKQTVGKPGSWSSCTMEQAPLEPRGVAVKPMIEEKISVPRRAEWNFESMALKGTEGSNTSPRCNQENAIAERKRRLKLNELFTILSTIIPGLKKIDKASLLGDAINYVRQLEAKLKTLEEKVESCVKSITLAKNSCSSMKYDNLSNSDDPFRKSLLNVEVKLTGRTFIVRIHCEKRKGILVKVISEVEKLPFEITNTSCTSSCSSYFNITMVAKIEEGTSMTKEEHEKSLISAFSQYM